MMSVTRPFFPHVLFVRFGQAFAVKVQGQRSAHCLGFQVRKTHEFNIQMVETELNAMGWTKITITILDEVVFYVYIYIHMLRS